MYFLIFALLLLSYFSIGIGMFLMICLMNKHNEIQKLIGDNYSWWIIYMWPGVVEEIYNRYWK